MVNILDITDLGDDKYEKYTVEEIHKNNLIEMEIVRKEIIGKPPFHRTIDEDHMLGFIELVFEAEKIKKKRKLSSTK